MTRKSPQGPKRPTQDPGIFIGIAGLVAALFIPIMQANGVDVNWQASLGLYLLLTAICVWSLLRYAIPRSSGSSKAGMTVLLIAVMCGLGVFATLKQYRREHNDPHLRAIGVLLVEPVVVGEPMKFIVSVKNEGAAGSLQFSSGSVISNHLISTAHRQEVEAMFFGMTTEGFDNPVVMKPILEFEADETEAWSFNGTIATDQQVRDLGNGAVPYFAGKGRYVGRQDLPPFEICFYWPHGFGGGAVKCDSHNSL